ncbi:MAG: PIN domain-containing protein [Spirochaetales bacterium]|nr:PIN domain-containing protein [Spirochaetales bacterium]
MKVIIDTNVAMDFMSDRQPHSDMAEKVFTFCCSELAEGYMTANSLCDLNYILGKCLKDKEQKKSIISFWHHFIRILDTGDVDISHALSSDMDDFEDAVIASVAARNRCDYIVTRNVKDFEKSPVPAITPEEFIPIAMRQDL